MNEFENIIANSINLNLKLRENIEKNMYNPIVFAREFCTVKVDIGRRVGKTIYIKNNAKLGDIIVVQNEHTKRRIKQQFYNYSEIITVDDLNNDSKFVFKNPKTIWVDDAKLSANDVDKLYKLLTRKDLNQLFVFLGDNSYSNKSTTYIHPLTENIQTIGELLCLNGRFLVDYGTDDIIEKIKDLYRELCHAKSSL